MNKEKRRLKRQKRKKAITRFNVQYKGSDRDYKGRVFGKDGWIYPPAILRQMIDAKKRKEDKRKEKTESISH